MLEKDNLKRSAFDQDQPVRADACRSKYTLLRAAMVPRIADRLESTLVFNKAWGDSSQT